MFHVTKRTATSLAFSTGIVGSAATRASARDGEAEPEIAQANREVAESTLTDAGRAVTLRFDAPRIRVHARDRHRVGKLALAIIAEGSGRTIDETGSFSPLAPEALQETLRTLKAKHPGFFLNLPSKR